ncbi:MAG: protein phosphatase CheZ [Proteobacteria bacterium]|nr:MAG: protein phosphatase CheZ [Pseudomonadota bacterium]
MAIRPENTKALPDVEAVRALLKHLESDNRAGAEALFDELLALRESQMFQQLGRLTRDIHDALRNFHLDERLSKLADEEIPDAKQRLNYVIEMTGQSAHRTLNAVEACLPLSEQIEIQGGELLADWERFRNRELTMEEFKGLSSRISDYFSTAAQCAASMRGELSDVMMAQDFQDLTGQVIRRVITLVQEVEDKLVDLVRAAGGRIKSGAPEVKEASLSQGEGPTPPALLTDDRVANQDDVDDLLSSLGF